MRHWQKIAIEIGIHMLFWSLSFLILVNHFAISSAVQPIDYVFTGLFIFSLLPAVYFNLYLAIPSLFKRKKYVLYLLSLGGCLLLFLGVHALVFQYLSPWLLPDYYIIGYYDNVLLLTYIGIFLGTTTLLQLSRSWFELIERERHIQQLEMLKTQAELDALKAQINPHFLFNSLNSIYALSLRQSDSVSDVTLKLADVLRYMIYDAQADQVNVSDEVIFLEKYIDVQTLRLQPETAVRFVKKGHWEKLQIAPLLLIVFVENAFKHGAQAKHEKPFVHIYFEVQQGALLFEVINNPGQGIPIEKTASSGLGLPNVQKRLRLLYPEHQLTIENTASHFKISLKIPNLAQLVDHD